MDLQISVFLLVVLLTGGHARECYQCGGPAGSCANQQLAQCKSGITQCTSTAVTQIGVTSTTAYSKGCALSSDCQSWSFNFGTLKNTSSCCDTEGCNVKDPSESSSNGKKCYYCDGKSCTNTVSCSGTEVHCINATGTIEGLSFGVKGCASKSICDATVKPSVGSVKLSGIFCCEGNLCNGAQSVTQSFLFLCCSLLSYFLLH